MTAPTEKLHPFAAEVARAIAEQPDGTIGIAVDTLIGCAERLVRMPAAEQQEVLPHLAALVLRTQRLMPEAPAAMHLAVLVVAGLGSLADAMQVLTKAGAEIPQQQLDNVVGAVRAAHVNQTIDPSKSPLATRLKNLR